MFLYFFKSQSLFSSINPDNLIVTVTFLKNSLLGIKTDLKISALFVWLKYIAKNKQRTLTNKYDNSNVVSFIIFRCSKLLCSRCRRCRHCSTSHRITITFKVISEEWRRRTRRLKVRPPCNNSSSSNRISKLPLDSITLLILQISIKFIETRTDARLRLFQCLGWK